MMNGLVGTDWVKQFTLEPCWIKEIEHQINHNLVEWQSRYGVEWSFDLVSVLYL